MSTVFVVVILKSVQLRLQIGRCPEQQLIQAFSSDRSNQSFHEGMGPWNIRNGFDLLDAQDSEVGLPLMKPVQRIMIRTEVFRKFRPSNGLFEHPAECHAVDDAGLYSKADDSASVLVHHH